MSPVVMPTPN